MGSQELSSRWLISPKDHCHQRKSRSSFLDRYQDSAPLPLTEALEFYPFLCKGKREQPKSPRLLEKDCSGAIPQSAELSPGQV